MKVLRVSTKSNQSLRSRTCVEKNNTKKKNYYMQQKKGGWGGVGWGGKEP